MLPDSTALDTAAVADALVALDAKCCVVGVNSAFARMLGVAPDDVVGRDFVATFRPRDGDGEPYSGWPVAARMAAVRAMAQVEVDLTHAGGRTVKTLMAGSYLRDSTGELAGGVLSLRDLGHRRLESTAAQAVATVSHEVRAPLTSVRGFASLLLRKGDSLEPEQRREMLEQILSDAERMTRLVGELLDVSRLEAGRVTYRLEPLDIGVICRSAVASAETIIGAPERPVTVDAPEGLHVRADRDKLTQILVNLVENARKYGEAPIVVAAGADEDAGTVEVTVSDSGLIPPDVLPRLFSKYWRRDRPGRPTGTGLGLFLAKGLAQGQGGDLVCTSSPGSGTVFTLTLQAG